MKLNIDHTKDDVFEAFSLTDDEIRSLYKIIESALKNSKRTPPQPNVSISEACERVIRSLKVAYSGKAMGREDVVLFFAGIMLSKVLDNVSTVELEGEVPPGIN